VFPLAAGTKIPFKDTAGLHGAMRHAGLVRAVWESFPDANIGLATGKGLLAIDEDAHGANDGRAYIATHPDLFPATVTALTPTGGRHLFYALPAGVRIGNSDRALPPGINVRGDGGYVVAAPSLHPDGGRYQWAPGGAPWERPLTPIPPALLALLTPPEPPPPPAPVLRAAAPVTGVQDGSPRVPSAQYLTDWALKRASIGSRNRTGFLLARQLLANGHTGGDGERAMCEYADRVPHTPADPYTQRDALRSWQSAHKYAVLAPWDLRRGTLPADGMPDVAALAPALAAQVDPTTGEIVGSVDAGLVFQLVTDLHVAEQRAAFAEQRADRVAFLWERARRWMATPITNGNVLRTGFFLLPQLDHLTDLAGDPAARVRAPIQEIARLSNQSPVKVGRDLKQMAELGWLAREQVKEPAEIAPTPPTPILVKAGKRPVLLTMPRPRPFVTHIYITASPELLTADTAALTPTEKGQWGSPAGKRPRSCEACGSTDLHALAYQCRRCGHEQAAAPEELAPPAPTFAAAVADWQPVNQQPVLVTGVQDGSPCGDVIDVRSWPLEPPVTGAGFVQQYDPHRGYGEETGVQTLHPSRFVNPLPRPQDAAHL
jgi:hypothetical protein